jgi:hypothetical protein
MPLGVHSGEHKVSSGTSVIEAEGSSADATD